MPIDKKTYGKEPRIIKALKGAARQTDAMQAQTDRPAASSSVAYKEAREAPKRMLEGMEKSRTKKFKKGGMVRDYSK